MPGAGLEPARSCPQGILSPQCLPFHHLGRLCTQNIENFEAIISNKIENLYGFYHIFLLKLFSVYKYLLLGRNNIYYGVV